MRLILPNVQNCDTRAPASNARALKYDLVRAEYQKLAGTGHKKQAKPFGLTGQKIISRRAYCFA